MTDAEKLKELYEEKMKEIDRLAARGMGKHSCDYCTEIFEIIHKEEILQKKINEAISYIGCAIGFDEEDRRYLLKLLEGDDD